MDALVVMQAVLVVAVLAGLWVVADWPAHRRRLVRLGEVLHLHGPVPPRPAGPPIEQIAADLRRVRAQIDHAPPGTPVARRRGWTEAYDDLLVTACHELGIEQSIRQAHEGSARDLERERVERSLLRAGLAFRARS
ncbi:MAG: hypothetical protein LT071_00355, partial [Nocardioides sp.]|nr:hypothetical protein [Nocardioides sp.]